MTGATQQVTLSIAGMGCGGCAAKIEKLLGQATGVRAASVSFPRAEAVVEYDPAVTGSAALVGLLAEAGYTVPVPEAPDVAHG